MHRTTITLSEPVAKLLGEEAQRRKTSVSAVARELITQGLIGGGKKRKIPWAGLVSDPEMVPSDRIDEELKARWVDDPDRGCR
jgi:Ribbon-helix-helix protein, copG family